MKTLIATCLEGVCFAQGALGAALVDVQTGVLLGKHEVAPALAMAEAGDLSADLVVAKRRTLRRLGLDDRVEALLMTFETQLYVIKPSQHNTNLAWFVILDRLTADAEQALGSLGEAERQFVDQLDGVLGEQDLDVDIER